MTDINYLEDIYKSSCTRSQIIIALGSKIATLKQRWNQNLAIVLQDNAAIKQYLNIDLCDLGHFDDFLVNTQNVLKLGTNLNDDQ